MLILASGITVDKQKRALLLYQAKQRVGEILRRIQNTGEEWDYKFRQVAQDPNETFDQFHTRLLTLPQPRSFPDIDFEIKQQIITAGTSSRVRKKALRDPTYDLKAILLDGRRYHQSVFQARDIEWKEKGTDEIHRLNQTEETCRNCGGSYPHAWKQTMYKVKPFCVENYTR